MKERDKNLSINESKRTGCKKTVNDIAFKFSRLSLTGNARSQWNVPQGRRTREEIIRIDKNALLND